MTPINPQKQDSYDYGTLNRENRDEEARNAYRKGDVDASKDAHSSDKILHSADEEHRTWGDHLKASQFGGLDGILASFAIVTSAAGSGLSWMAVVAVGYGVVFASALSMGIGEFLSEKGEIEWILAEKEREEWEVENNQEGEIEEMVEIYMKKSGGRMPRKEAEMIIDTIASYPEIFIDNMMTQELGLQVPDDDWKWESAKSGVVMFTSFIIFGSVPILGYIILPLSNPAIANQHHSMTLLLFACCVTSITLFMLGCLKSRFGTTPWWQNGMETMLLGALCGAIAFSISKAVTGAYVAPRVTGASYVVPGAYVAPGAYAAPGAYVAPSLI